MLDRLRDFFSNATPAQRSILAICTALPFLLAFTVAPGIGLIVPAFNNLLVPEFIIGGGVCILLVMAILVGMLIWLWPRRRHTRPLPHVYAAVTLLATTGFMVTAFLGGNLTYPSNIVIIGLVPCGLLMLDMRSTALGLGLGLLTIGLNDLAIFTGMVRYAPGYGPGAFVDGQHDFWAEMLRTGIQYVSVVAYCLLIWVLFGHYDYHQKRLKTMSQIDVLTGLANRRFFMERLDQECGRLGRSEHPLSLVMIDADHFKKINDTHGHLVGDQVLKTLADLLREHMRVPSDLPARIGGEEFAIILPDTGLAGAQSVCRRIQESLARITFQGAQGPFKASLSMGVVESNGHAAETLLHYADANLYLAKAQGRNRIVATRLESERCYVSPDPVA
jgi:diguanylate cyclase (GGDEF)-like protein